MEYRLLDDNDLYFFSFKKINRIKVSDFYKNKVLTLIRSLFLV